MSGRTDATVRDRTTVDGEILCSWGHASGWALVRVAGVLLTRLGGDRVISAPDDGLSERQQAVLDVIRASHPRPVAVDQLAARLGIAEGGLNSTLPSLHRRRLVSPAPSTVRQHGGWTAPHAT